MTLTNIGSITTGVNVTTDGVISDIDDAFVSFGESIDVSGDASVSGSLVLYSGSSTIDVLDNSTLTFQGSYSGDAGLTTLATLNQSGDLNITGDLTVSGGDIDVCGEASNITIADTYS